MPDNGPSAMACTEMSSHCCGPGSMSAGPASVHFTGIHVIIGLGFKFNIRVRVSFTTEEVWSAILATAGLLGSFVVSCVIDLLIAGRC